MAYVFTEQAPKSAEMIAADRVKDNAPALLRALRMALPYIDKLGTDEEFNQAHDAITRATGVMPC
jgi:hypothetical protein